MTEGAKYDLLSLQVLFSMAVDYPNIFNIAHFGLPSSVPSLKKENN